MTTGLEAHDIVFADTSLFCRVEEVLGWLGLFALVEFFDESLRIVTDVERELRGHAAGRFPGLNMLEKIPKRDEFLRVAAEQISPQLAVQVGQIAGTWPREATDGQLKHYGEIATVLMAEASGVPVILDDGAGHRFARLRGVTTYNTRDVAVCMVIHGALSPDDGALVWAKVYESNSSRTAFDAAVAAARAARRPQPE